MASNVPNTHELINLLIDSSECCLAIVIDFHGDIDPNAIEIEFYTSTRESPNELTKFAVSNIPGSVRVDQLTWQRLRSQLNSGYKKNYFSLKL